MRANSTGSEWRVERWAFASALPGSGAAACLNTPAGLLFVSTRSKLQSEKTMDG